MPTPAVVAVDLGGTRVKMGFVDGDGAVLEHDAFDTDSFDGPEALARAIGTEVDARRERYDLLGVGIGAPNGNHYRGTVEHPPNLPWPGVTPLAALLTAATGLPTRLDNDANAAALGEKRFGAAKVVQDFLYITLGTGLGSGIVSRGQLVRGHSGFAGEIGHVIVEADGRPCGCGRRGCLEQYASATGLAKTYRALVPEAPDDADALYVFQRAKAGDALALDAFEQTGRVLGLALANSVAYTSPEAIFLFGGLADAGETLFGPVRRHFEANLLTVYRGTVAILPSGLSSGDAALLGAASLVWHDRPAA